MPHSSGGGSHSGGSHSGGSHGSGSSYRSSRKPFKGARHYVIYRRHHYMHYYTTEPNPKPWTKKTLRQWALWMLVIIPIILSCFVAFTEYFKPKMTRMDYTDTNIYVIDYANVFSDEQISSLASSLTALQTKTGVTPALEIVIPEQSAGYSSLEDMAYQEYVNKFADEKHWLLLVEYPEGDRFSEYREWKHEGMIGDDVGKTFNEYYEELFTNTVQANLLRCGDTDLFDALKTAYDEFTDLSMQTVFNKYAVIGCWILIEFVMLFIFAVAYIEYKISQKWANAVFLGESSDKYAEVQCPHCGGVYLAGTVNDCPYCKKSVL